MLLDIGLIKVLYAFEYEKFNMPGITSGFYKHTKYLYFISYNVAFHASTKIPICLYSKEIK